MATATQTTGNSGGFPVVSQESTNVVFIVLRYLGLALLNALGLIFVYSFLFDDNLGLAIVFGVILVGANLIVFMPSLYPLRWMTPGLMLITLLVLYPIVYTFVTAFTNYGDGHLLTKDQAIDLIGQRPFVPEDAQLYSWVLFQSESGQFALWLDGEDADGNRVVAFAPIDGEIIEVNDPPEEAPQSFEGFIQLDAAARTQALGQIQDAVFGQGEDTAGIASRRQAARPLEQRYEYDSELDALVDRTDGTIYTADNEEGFFTAENGDRLAPGYRVNIGLENFRRLYEDRTLLEPLISVFFWTVAFALLSVLTTFVMGLFMAIILDDPAIPFRKFWRSLIFIPYAIPGVIGILVWRGMLNENLGIITNFLASSFGVDINWFSDPNAARFAIILVNLWLGYPYMMLICSGALQAIPSEVYEAAAVDGANNQQRFWGITLPLLLITVGPLLIASFTFNFNNYLLIEALTGGSPPIPGTSTPAGRTDILISYTYNLAFGSNTGADYGYASAITLVIFAIVGTITLFNFRFVQNWERTSDNV